MAGSLQKSTEVMQTMHNLIKVPEVAATMRDLSKEMMKVRKHKLLNAYTLVWTNLSEFRLESLKKCWMIQWKT